MLRYIRKFGLQLFEAKARKYILFAVAEIFLIVIGIMIALSIDNWNQERKDLAKEQKIILQLKGEYEENLIRLDKQILIRNQIIQASATILRYIENPEHVSRDSLLSHLRFLMRTPSFNSIANDLFASGDLHHIRNDSLKHRLSNWTSDIYQLLNLEREWQKIRTEYVIDFTIKIGVQRDLANLIWKSGYAPIFILDESMNVVHKIGTSKKAPNVEIILANVELEGLASTALTWSQYGNMQSLALRNRIVEIINLLDREIK